MAAGTAKLQTVKWKSPPRAPIKPSTRRSRRAPGPGWRPCRRRHAADDERLRPAAELLREDRFVQARAAERRLILLLGAGAGLEEVHLDAALDVDLAVSGGLD